MSNRAVNPAKSSAVGESATPVTRKRRLFACDAETKREILKERRELGHDRLDEVWEGVYVMSPMADDEHQEITAFFIGVLLAVVEWSRLGKVRPGVNISDRRKGWRRNYRCPDVAVFLPGCPAINCGAFWFGGPDFAAEIISKFDRTRKKLGFYAKVGTRELLIVDRNPWALELYVLKDNQLELAGRSTVDDPQTLSSTVLPLAVRLVAGDARPQIEVTRSDGSERWLV